MGLFGDEFAFTDDTENAFMTARKRFSFHTPILL